MSKWTAWLLMGITASLAGVLLWFGADVYAVWARTSGGGRQNRGATVALELVPREGPVARRSRFGPSFGTQPQAMADEISRFIAEPSGPTLTTWWMPWLVNVGAVPFVLIVGGVVGEVLLRALGFFKPASDA